MASIRDLGSTRRSLTVLHFLLQREPVNMTEFTEASELFPNYAKRLREELVGLGLVQVKVVRRQGPAEIMEIRLTPLGRRVAEHLGAIDGLLQADEAKAARKKAARSRDVRPS